MDAEIIDTCKRYITENNVCALQVYYSELQNTEFPKQPDWPLIFHRVYLHACLKGLQPVVEWLEKELFPHMDPIQKIALRQIFPYGKHLLTQAQRHKKS
jgi:hypothetical protein